MTDLQNAGPDGTLASTDNPATSPVMGGPSHKDTPPQLSPAKPREGSNGMASETSGLTPDNRSLFEKKGWKDMNDALSSYDALSKKLGSSLNPPEADASPEDWQKFYARLGCPQDPGEYHFNLPEGLPEDFPYDTESADAFKAWAKSAGLTPKQADSLHGDYVRMQAAQIDEMNQRFTKSESQAHERLSQTWGGENTEQYQQSLGHARAALNGAGDGVETALMEAGLLSEDGFLRNADLGIWLAKLGANYYSDDQFASGGHNGVSNNPFLPDETGKTNLTAEAQAIKNDPERAVALIRAAGREKEFSGFFK